jgi:hypothetical protein
MNINQPIESRISELLLSRAGIEVLAELQKIDPLSLNYSGRLEYLETLQKQAGWLDALMQSALCAVAGDAPGKHREIYGVDELEREDVSTVLRISPNTAQSKIDVARTLMNHLPNVQNALAMGEISSHVAAVIARESDAAIIQGLPVDAIRAIEAIALSHAENHSPVQIANKIRTTIAKLSPENFEEQVARAQEERYVFMTPEPHGMARIIALLPAAEAQTVMFALDKMARIAKEKLRAERDVGAVRTAGTDGEAGGVREASTGGEAGGVREASTNGEASAVPETVTNGEAGGVRNTGASAVKSGRLPNLDLLRADALANLAAHYLESNAELAPQHRRPVSVNLTIDLPTMLGLTDNPGQLAGYGPIPASIARELAADGKWRRFITEPITGELLNYGRDTYEPRQGLVDFILARDQICRFPGCRQPGRVSDIDHAISWDSGGETSAENMGLLCRRHHQMKTSEGWLLESHADGSCTWISPAGKKLFVPIRPVNEVA